MTTNDDFWKPFGETRWRDFANTAGASEMQLKFCVARFSGASAASAARTAGYAGDDHDAIRRAGYDAVRSTAVVNLMELAEINAPEQAQLTDKELDAKVAKLVRSADPNVSLKAAEFHDKRKQRKKEEAANEPEESLEELFASIIRSLPDGLGAVFAMAAFEKGAKNIVNFPFLKECAPIVAKRYPTTWKEWREKNGPYRQWALKFLDEVAAGPVLDDAALDAAVSAKTPRRPKMEIPTNANSDPL